MKSKPGRREKIFRAAIETLETRTLFSLAAPTVNTGAATLLSATGATLNATVNPQGSTDSAYFQYSTNPALTPTVVTTIGSGFSFPSGVTVDAAGNVFVADHSNNAVKEVSNGTITTFTGFNSPWGVAVDAAGDIFVADSGNNAVKKILPNGTINAVGAGFNQPLGMAVDAAGDVFVADTNNFAVKEVLPNGTINTLGSGFNGPHGVAVDASGNVFVADTFNNAVKEILPNGTIQVIGSGFNQPSDVVVDASGDVFVADYGNFAVKEVLPNGAINAFNSGFANPLGVAVDAAGDIFVADIGNNQVVELSPPTLVATPSSLNGPTTPISGTLNALSPSTTYYFRAVANGINGTVTGSTSSFTTLIGQSINFTAPTSPIVFSQNQTVPLVATGGASGNPIVFTIDPASTGTGNISGSTLTVTNSGNFVIDANQAGNGAYAAAAQVQQALLVIKAPPTVSSGAATSVSATDATLNATINPQGSTDSTYFQYSTSPLFTPTAITTIGSGFNFPTGVAVDAAGDVIVADHSNNDAKVVSNGTITTFTGFNQPWGIAVDAAGDIFVADTGNNSVKKILPNGTTTVLGAGFAGPLGVAADAAGDVFVADTGNNAVKEILPNGTINVLGSGFGGPHGVAVDPAGDVFVADTFNNAVKEILPNGTIRAIGSGFNQPSAVAVDSSGNVFVVDFGNFLVKEVLSNGTINTIGSGFSSPYGVAVDAVGDVFVTDIGTNHVVEISPPTVAASPSPLTGSTDTSISATLGSLTPATTYYYRAVAAGVNGAVAGATNSFATVIAQSINFTAPASPIVFAPNETVSLIATGGASGNPVVFTIDPASTGTGSISGSTLTVTHAGSFVLDANQSGNTTYAAAVQVQRTLVVNKATPTATLTVSIPQQVYSGAAQSTTVVVSSSSVPGTVSNIFIGGAATQTAPGVYLVTADFVPTDRIDYNVLSALSVGNFLIVRAAPTITGSSANILSPTSARLNATVNPQGTTDAVYFQYSTSSYFTPTVATTIGSGFHFPSGVAVDAVGDVFVADYGNNAVKEVSNGTVQTLGSGFNQPLGVAVDVAGNVFVADTSNNAVKEILPNGTINTLGSGFSNPTGVVVDAAGNVFVADHGNNAIKEILPNGTVQTIGSGFSFPTGVTLDSAGNLFVADSGNNAVKKVSGGTVTTFASGLNSPSGVAVDSAGDVFVTDTNNSAVKEFLTNGKTQTIGSGFNNPSGVALDSVGDVFIADLSIADLSKNRVVELSPPTVAATPSSISGSTAASVSGTLTGLSTSVYFYRVVATGLNGTVASSSSFFILLNPQTIHFTAPASPIVFAPGETVTLIATGGASGNPVVFTIDPSSTGVGSIAGGILTVTQPGNFVLDANQAGDSTYAAAAQVQQALVVNNGTPTTTSLAAPATAASGQSVSFVTTVTSNAGTPGGSVTFLNGAISLGSATLDGLGRATFTSSTLAVGAYNLTASYSGAGTPFAGSSSTPSLLLIGTSNQRYVNQLYVDLFKRNADTGGLDAWTGVLDSGALSRAQVATALTSSREYDGIVVDAFYFTYLGRHAESGGLNAWIDQMQKGLNAEVIRAGILGSDEYYNRTGPGNQNGTDATFITSLYQTFLGRAPDSAGLAAWLGALNGNPANRQTIASGISNSDENRTVIITGFYQTYLHRDPDAAGLAAWKNQLAGGISQPAIISFFVTTSEYLSINHIA